MKQSITLPSISSILNNNNHDDESNKPHITKLPAISNQYHQQQQHQHQQQQHQNKNKHDNDIKIFLPTSPVSLSSLSPIQQYDTNHQSFSIQAPPSPLIPSTPNSKSPLNKKEVSVTENSDSSPLTHSPSLFPIIFAPPLKFPTPYNSKSDDEKGKKSFIPSSSTKKITSQQLQIIQSTSRDGTIKKQRRGRPPVYSDYHCQRGPGTTDNQQWTFLTPTVWDIPTSSPSKPTTTSPTCAMTTFSSITLEPELPPPRKKRGRNPKQHIQGNSCFLWKEIPIVRRKKNRPLLGQK